MGIPSRTPRDGLWRALLTVPQSLQDGRWVYKMVVVQSQAGTPIPTVLDEPHYWLSTFDPVFNLNSSSVTGQLGVLGPEDGRQLFRRRQLALDQLAEEDLVDSAFSSRCCCPFLWSDASCSGYFECAVAFETCCVVGLPRSESRNSANKSRVFLRRKTRSICDMPLKSRKASCLRLLSFASSDLSDGSSSFLNHWYFQLRQSCSSFGRKAALHQLR